jgi:plasmid stabilization system protein ParE
MVRIIWLEDAIVSLEAIRGYLRQFNPEAADHFVQRLADAGNSLADFPNRGRLCDDGFRELVSVSPYVLRYWVADHTVYIARIKHGRQLR